MEFLSSPWNLWQSGQLQYRRPVLRLAFAERVPYRRCEGFSNVKTALPFNVLSRLSMGGNKMARPKGGHPSFSKLRFIRRLAVAPPWFLARLYQVSGHWPAE